MKKILILILSLFIITSCWNNTQDINITNKADINNEKQDTANIMHNNWEQEDVLNEWITSNKILDPILDRINNWKIDTEFCDSIENNKIKLRCKVELKSREERKVIFETTEKAKNDLDIKVCNSLNNQDQKNNCISWVIETKIQFWVKDKRICDEIPEWNKQLELLINRCLSNYYYSQAKEKQDIQLCDKIWDKLQKSSCLNEIFNTEKENITDIKYCDIFWNDLNKNDCINKVNKNLTKNTMVIKSCDRFTENIQKNSCKREVIMRNAEVGIDKCNYATDNILKNECSQKLNFTKWVKEKTLKYCWDSSNWWNLEISTCKSNIINELNKTENTDKYCELYTESKLKVEQCKQDINNIVSVEISPKQFCDNLMTNTDWSSVDKQKCYELVWQ